ncbi:three-helix bundle dimerization domain-containing protein [Agromyces sp. CCNWLW203]|uniref:three-helix bundle dimerization domain-containing protein n=1 Tax=Agromyces sp. CCNWLW203 TaxID=3112842 RepID=UPI002F9652E3
MDHTEEVRAVDEVVDRLVGRFPDLTRDRIAAVVEAAHLELEGNPVRDFVPVLVERTAKQRLKQEATASPVMVESVPGDSVPGVSAVADAGRHDDDLVELDPMEIERRARERESGFLFGDLGGGPN